MNIKTKYDIRLEQQFMYNFNKVIETFPQYTIAQHMAHLMRKKTDDRQSYYWTNEKALSTIEAYYDELLNELATGGFKEMEDY